MNRSMRAVVISCLILFVLAQSALAQHDPGQLPPESVRWHAVDARDNGGGSKKPEETAAETDNIRAESEARKKAWVRYTILLGAPVNTYVVSLFTWSWGSTTKFRLSHEGWFGQNTYAGGADKAAHLFSHYLLMRALYNIYNYTEDGAPSKWAYSAGLTTLLALGIELGDGFCKKQEGFSAGDLTMGLLGIGIASLLELFPAADAFLGLSAEYYPTKYFRTHPQRLIWFMDDYSGWRFMANIKLAGFRYVGVNVPEFMRYIMIDVGYHTHDYTRFDYRYAEIGRAFGGRFMKREIFIGVSVNLAEVIKDFFTDKESLECRALQQPFKYLHVPLGARNSFRL
jgi:hypothetical protein